MPVTKEGRERKLAALVEANNIRFEKRRAEVTDTHKRCSKCREWKYLHYYYPEEGGLGGVRAECKACHNKRMREYRYKRPEIAYQKELDRNNAYMREYRAKKVAERKKAARDAIRWFKNAGYSITGIQRLTGVDRNALSHIMSRDCKFVHDRTIEKLKTVQKAMIQKNLDG